MRMCVPVLAVLVCAVVCAQEVAEYLCLRTDTAPAVDGRTEDACWQTASEAPVLYQTGVAGEQARNETKVRLLMDGQALYLAADAPTAPGAPPSAAETTRDGKTWNDDSLEVFLSTSFVSDDYYHLAFNALGTQMDALVSRSTPPEQSTDWNGDWRVVTTTRDGGWSAEARLPWAAFGLTEAPPQGFVWRIKIGCTAKGFENSMWPRNDTDSFHNRNCWGYLVLQDANLQTNPGFEEGIPDKGPPRGWSYAYYEAEGKGVCSVTDGDAASGRFAGRLEKTDDKDWFPVLYTALLPVQPGSAYELSAMAKCDREFRMRYNLAGERGDKRSVPVPATEGWRRVSLQATIPETGVKELQVGFQLIATTGVILIDDMQIRRRNDLGGTIETEPRPHPFHNLQELCSRTAFKPYELLANADGSYQTDLVIFEDSVTGAPITMCTRSAGQSSRHTYMEISPWNADGSLLCLTSGQLGKGTMLMPADGSSRRKLAFYASSPIWDRRDRSRLYFRKYRGHEKTDLWDLAIGDVAAGTLETTRRFEGDIGLWPMSQDGEKLLVQEKLVGDDGKLTSRLWIMDRDGKNGLELDPKGLVHQTWFTKLPDYSIEFEWEGQRPAGQYHITTDGQVLKVFDQTYGHRAHSPDGNWLAIIGPCAVRNVHTGETKVISDEGSNHQTWEVSNDWYATSDGLYLKRVVVSGSPTVQRIGAHNSQLKYSTYWSEPHPEMSPDGTKLGYASSMLGDIDFYAMQMALPDAPRQLQRTRHELSWLPGEHARELAGYMVYYTNHHGTWGVPLTPAPIAETTYELSPERLRKLREPGAASPGFLYVTAVEYSGLESLASNDVSTASDWPYAFSFYSEAEEGKYHAPAVEVYDPQAAGMYALLLGRLQAAGPVTLVLRGEEWVMGQDLWVRARARRPAALRAECKGADLGTVEVTQDQWTWLRLPRGPEKAAFEHEITLTPLGPGICVDRVLLTSDDKLVPTGKGRCDEEAPKVTGLAAEAAGRYAVRLKWEPSAATDLRHYNVYCGVSPELQPTQERLIASPSTASYVDWGLQAGTTYHYRVTAVDRAGNESAPTDIAPVTTEALDPRIELHLDAVWNTRETPEAELPFALPVASDFVVWGQVESLDGSRSAGLKLSLDGQRLGEHSIAFDYVCVGHGGPVLGAKFWDCIKPARNTLQAPVAFHAEAGDHVLKLAATPELEVLWEGFVVTNDLGYRPEGTVDFVVGRQ